MWVITFSLMSICAMLDAILDIPLLPTLYLLLLRPSLHHLVHPVLVDLSLDSGLGLVYISCCGWDSA